MNLHCWQEKVPAFDDKMNFTPHADLDHILVMFYPSSVNSIFLLHWDNWWCLKKKKVGKPFSTLCISSCGKLLLTCVPRGDKTSYKNWFHWSQVCPFSCECSVRVCVMCGCVRVCVCECVCARSMFLLRLSFWEVRCPWRVCSHLSWAVSHLLIQKCQLLEIICHKKTSRFILHWTLTELSCQSVLCKLVMDKLKLVGRLDEFLAVLQILNKSISS